MLLLVALVVIGLSVAASGQTLTDPCATRTCPRGQECRLQSSRGGQLTAICRQVDNSINPCRTGKPVLSTVTYNPVNCGRGIGRETCPRGTNCIIDPTDRFAVCCLGKPGRCPRQTGVGICIARCESDFSCPGRQICCGNCPRECTNPR